MMEEKEEIKTYTTQDGAIYYYAESEKVKMKEWIESPEGKAYIAQENYRRQPTEENLEIAVKAMIISRMNQLYPPCTKSAT